MFAALVYVLLTYLFSVALGEPRVHDPSLDLTYSGISLNNVEYFQNIRYANSTEGVNRFAAPKPFTYGKGSIIDATGRGPSCPQPQAALPPLFSEVPEISEDCLSLRITRPAGIDYDNAKPLPVLVWVHGGAVIWGSAYDEHFNPEKLLQQSMDDGKPVVFVAINYRLSIFGFASSPAIMEENAMNNGMRDQREALLWIQRNIGWFGGDATRITAFGQSAGGTFIGLQQVAYGGKEPAPFQQAFMMSGPTGTALNTTSNITAEHTASVAKTLGCDLSKDSKSVLACLRAVPMETLLKEEVSYAQQVHPPFGALVFVPSIDDDILPNQPSRLLRSGKFSRGISTVLSWAQNDASIYVGPAQDLKSEDDIFAPLSSWASNLTSSELSRMLSLYPASDFNAEATVYNQGKSESDTLTAQFFRLSRIVRDLIFTCPSFDFAHQLLKHPPIGRDFSSVRVYDINQSVLLPVWSVSGMPYAGVSHASDIAYVFNGVFPEGRMAEPDLDLAHSMSSSLIAFAYTGEPTIIAPGDDVAKEWPPVFDGSASRSDDLMPASFSALIAGGPYGTNEVTVSKQLLGGNSHARGHRATSGENASSGFYELFDPLRLSQKLVTSVLDYGFMKSSDSHIQQQLVEQEQLIERCAFMNSLADAQGT